MMRTLCILALSAMAAAPAFAADEEKIQGVWRIVSYELEFQDTSERRPALGTKPNGYLVFAPGNRMIAYLEAPERKAPTTDEERAAAYRTMLAYTGRYRLEGDKWITRVDASWNVSWTGTDQERFFKLDGDRLSVTSQWNRGASGRMIRGLLVFERER